MSHGRPSLVFAHYFGGSARSWAPLRAALDGDLAAVMPDVPGFGGTPPLAGGPDLAAYATWLDGLAPAGPWLAVGHSMGGKIAMAAALRRPRGLLALILIAASPPTPEPMSETDRRKSHADYGDRLAAEANMTRVTAGRLRPDLLATCVDDQLRADQATWDWWLDDGSRADISAGTARLALPVLVVAGEDDDVMGPAVAPAIAVNLHGRLVKIAGAGHLVPLEQPAAVARAIDGFVASLAA